MPKFFVIIISKILDFLAPKRVEFREEEAARAEARAARKEQLELEKAFLYEVRERQLENSKQEAKPSEDELQELITREEAWTIKATKEFYTPKWPEMAVPIFRHDRFYEVEVVPPYALKSVGLKTYVFAYVECREGKGATVFLYMPKSFDNKDDEYKALAFFDGKVEPIILKDEATIGMAERIFASLFEDQAA